MATHKLLTRIAEYSKRGWDFNAFFYLLESLSKRMFDEVFPYAREFIESMLELQTMDDEYFIRHGLIVPDSEKMDEYARRHGSAPFQIASGDIIKYMAGRDGLQQAQIHIQAIYATLLKIGLLKHEKLCTERKIRKLLDFFQNDLGVFLMREAVRSCLHFEGKSGKFIPLEVRARDVKRKLLASAWDLFLLRLPETLIVNEGNDYTSICYVCTAEKVLQRLGRMFVVRRVASFKEGRGSVPSSVSFREDLLKDEIGEELTARFFALYQQGATGPSCRTPKTLEEISSLVEALEHKSSEIAAI